MPQISEADLQEKNIPKTCEDESRIVLMLEIAARKNLKVHLFLSDTGIPERPGV
jgi:hypothetical protein